MRDHPQASLQHRAETGLTAAAGTFTTLLSWETRWVQPADPSLSPARLLLSSCPQAGAHSSCITTSQPQSSSKDPILPSHSLHWWGGFLKLFPN